MSVRAILAGIRPTLVTVGLPALVACLILPWWLGGPDDGWVDELDEAALVTAATALLTIVLTLLCQALLERTPLDQRLFAVGQRSFTGWVVALLAMLSGAVVGGAVAGFYGAYFGMVVSWISGGFPLVILVSLLLPSGWLGLGRHGPLLEQRWREEP